MSERPMDLLVIPQAFLNHLLYSLSLYVRQIRYLLRLQPRMLPVLICTTSEDLHPGLKYWRINSIKNGLNKDYCWIFTTFCYRDTRLCETSCCLNAALRHKKLGFVNRTHVHIRGIRYTNGSKWYKITLALVFVPKCCIAAWGYDERSNFCPSVCGYVLRQ